MRNKVFFVILILLFYLPVFASIDSTGARSAGSPGPFRISLIIGSPGEEVWETFGHSCIRVIDSSKIGGERDVIYNYGYFDATAGYIGNQFLTGRVRVFLDTITYHELIVEFTDKKRGLTEQVLILNDTQKEQIVKYLKNNLRNENRYYEYDTFFDNCTTRLRDMFVSLFGSNFVPGRAIPPDSRLTIRNIAVDQYCDEEQHKYWFGLFLSIFYAKKTDVPVSNDVVMFLPKYFGEGMAGATLYGKPLTEQTTTILEDKVVFKDEGNGPFLLFLVIAIITIASLLYTPYPVIGNIISTIVLCASGLLGCFIVYTWMLPGEPAWANNFNFLWALPTNIVIPFLKPAIKVKYAIVAIILIGISFLLSLMKIQVIPLYQISPLLLALIWIFAVMYRRNYAKTK